MPADSQPPYPTPTSYPYLAWCESGWHPWRPCTASSAPPIPKPVAAPPFRSLPANHPPRVPRRPPSCSQTLWTLLGHPWRPNPCPPRRPVAFPAQCAPKESDVVWPALQPSSRWSPCCGHPGENQNSCSSETWQTSGQRRPEGVVALRGRCASTVATILVVEHRCTIPRCTHPNSPWNPRKASLQAQDLSS